MQAFDLMFNELICLWNIESGLAFIALRFLFNLDCFHLV